LRLSGAVMVPDNRKGLSVRGGSSYGYFWV